MGYHVDNWLRKFFKVNFELEHGNNFNYNDGLSIFRYENVIIFAVTNTFVPAYQNKCQNLAVKFLGFMNFIKYASL